MLVSSDRKKELLAFCKKHDLKFKNLELLNMAFCHMSYAHENGKNRLESYERLEFLGDAVLKLAISDILFKKFEENLEGKLTEQRAAIVSDKFLGNLAEKINLSELILVGKCEQKTSIAKSSIAPCAFEALLGAIFLEYKNKGYCKAVEFLIKNFENEILSMDYINPKAKLQEFTQKQDHNLPEYIVLKEDGPAHKKTFTVGVYYNEKLIEKGSAASKKEAEFEAARKAIIKLEKENKGS